MSRNNPAFDRDEAIGGAPVGARVHTNPGASQSGLPARMSSRSASLPRKAQLPATAVERVDKGTPEETEAQQKTVRSTTGSVRDGSNSPSLDSGMIRALAEAVALVDDTTMPPRSDTIRTEASRPRYANPHLGAIKSEGFKQYTYRGLPVFDAYPHGAPKPDKTAGQPRRKIGRGAHHIVEAKYNLDSPIYRKTPHQEFIRTDLSKVRDDAELMDQLAQVLLGGDEQTRCMSQHFALELLKEVSNGQPVYYTRAVNGFTLADYFNDPASYPELPIESIDAKSQALFKAIQWLHGRGFFHNDMHAENVMYDRDRGELVLIDMNAPKSTDGIKAAERYEAATARLRRVVEQRRPD